MLFLDSDVGLPHIKFIENSINEFNKRNLDVATFTLLVNRGKKIDKIAVYVWNNWIKLMQKLFPHGASAFLVKKNIHESINGFDEGVVFAEDQHYVDRAAKKHKFGVISESIYISLRRYEKDGRFKTYLRYLIADIHILLLGPIRTNILNYRFDHYKEGKPKN